MLESLQDLFLQKQKSETVSFDKKPDDSTVFKKPKSIRRLNKKDISAPCNFKHVSGNRSVLLHNMPCAELGAKSKYMLVGVCRCSLQ